MNQREQLDLIIVAVYIVSVAYIIFRAIDSVEDQTVIRFDKSTLDPQLEEQNLKDTIDIDFKFDSPYNYDKQPQDLAITVSNKSKNKFLEVDWDRSAITSGGRSRRVIRIPPSKRVDLSSSQVASGISPGGSLKEKITAEDLLKLNADTQTLETTGPFVDVVGMKKSALGKKAGDKERVNYDNFASTKTSLRFSMHLAIRIYDLMNEESDRFHTLKCEFEIKKVPWTEYLPVKL